MLKKPHVIPQFSHTWGLGHGGHGFPHRCLRNEELPKLRGVFQVRSSSALGRTGVDYAVPRRGGDKKSGRWAEGEITTLWSRWAMELGTSWKMDDIFSSGL